MKLKTQNFQYGIIDLVKFLCALLIVTAHYVTENASGRINWLIENAVSLYIIVVPFFFCCAGFFLFKKILANPENGRNTIKAYCKRILIMYLGWSVVYLIFKIATWIRFGTSVGEIGKYLLNALFYSTYKTIWFLPALCVGVLLSYIFVRKMGFKKTAVIAGVFYLICALGVSYSFLTEKNAVFNTLLDGYNYIFESTRNGIFYGFPFVFLGALIANENNKKHQKVLSNFILTCVFGVCFVLEAFLLKYKCNAINANTLLFLVPFTYCFFKLCLSFNVKSGKVLKWMRKMSTTIFLCQRIYLSALPLLLPDTLFATLLSGNPYIGCAYVLIATAVLAEILILLSKKIKWISVLC